LCKLAGGSGGGEYEAWAGEPGTGGPNWGGYIGPQKNMLLEFSLGVTIRADLSRISGILVLTEEKKNSQLPSIRKENPKITGNLSTWAAEGTALREGRLGPF